MTGSALDELIERSRRIGQDRSLVVFGGGNTSVKATVTDHLGRAVSIMWVKGSGSDLVSATADDFPALRLDDLLPLQAIERDDMDDDEMVDLVSRGLLDPSAKRPSIETLLHAFVPATHVDHVHADAICALTNHAEGRRTVSEALGDRFAYLDWKRSGFALSRMVGKIVADGGDRLDGVVLAQHGLITWGDTSDECYAHTIAAVDRAVAYCDANRLAASAPTRCPDLPVDATRDAVLTLRGAMCAERHQVLRRDDRLRDIADRPDVDELVAASTSTADHMLRIKPWSVVVPAPADLDSVRAAVAGYADRYRAYLDRQQHRMPAGYGPHSAFPNVALVPGVGGFTAAANRRDAAALAEVALHTHGVAATTKDAFGTPTAMSEPDLFDVDYWPMELYKLSLKPAPRTLAGRVFVVTGAGSGIGRTVALHLAGLGANLTLADLDADAVAATAAAVEDAGSPEPVVSVGDQSSAAVVETMVTDTVDRFGGVDGIVANAGIAVTGDLHQLELADWQRVLDVNLTSAFLLTKAALRAMRTQGLGGSLVYIASKNAFGPGAGFGPYSVSKAGMVQLMRIAALEGGPVGVRSNAINPDAVFDNSRLWQGGIREERAAAHGIAADDLESFYANRNLLHRAVTTADVAATVSFLLSDASSRTTGAVVPVDGGVAAAFPR